MPEENIINISDDLALFDDLKSDVDITDDLQLFEDIPTEAPEGTKGQNGIYEAPVVGDSVIKAEAESTNVEAPIINFDEDVAPENIDSEFKYNNFKTDVKKKMSPFESKVFDKTEARMKQYGASKTPHQFSYEYETLVNNGVDSEAAAKEVGLERVEKDGKVSYRVPQGIIDGFKKYAEQEAKVLIKERNNEKDPFLKRMDASLLAGAGDFTANTMSLLGDLGLDLIGGYEEFTDKQYEALDAMSEKIQSGEESIISLAQDGKYAEAAGEATLQLGRTLPTLVTLMAGGEGALAKIPLGIMAGGVASKKYRDLKDEDIPEYLKVASAVSDGIAEFVFEGSVTLPMINKTRRMMMKMGREATEKKLKPLFINEFDRVLTGVIGAGGPIVKESASEGATSLMQNLGDIAYLGKDVDIMRGVGDAMIVGGLMGKGISAPIDVANVKTYLKSKVESIPKKYNAADKFGLAELIVEKDVLKKEKAETDESFHDEINAKIEEVDKKIDGIKESAAKKVEGDDVEIGDAEDPIAKQNAEDAETERILKDAPVEESEEEVVEEVPKDAATDETKPKAEESTEEPKPVKAKPRTKVEQIKDKKAKADDIEFKYNERVAKHPERESKKTDKVAFDRIRGALKPSQGTPKLISDKWANETKSINDNLADETISFQDATKQLREVSEIAETEVIKKQTKDEVKKLRKGGDQWAKSMAVQADSILSVVDRAKKQFKKGLTNSGLSANEIAQRVKGKFTEAYISEIEAAHMAEYDAEIERLENSSLKSEQAEAEVMFLAKQELANWQNMSAEEVSEAFEFIKGEREEKAGRINKLRAKKKARKEALAESVEADIDPSIISALESINPAARERKTSLSKAIALMNKESGFKAKLKALKGVIADTFYLKGRGSGFIFGSKNWNSNLQTIGNAMFGDKKSAANDVIKASMEAPNKRRDIVVNSNTKLFDRVAKLFGTKGDVATRHEIVKAISGVMHNVPVKDGLEISLINSHAMEYWYHAKNTRSRAILIENNGFTEETFEYLDKTLTDVQKQLTEAHAEAMQAFEAKLFEIAKEKGVPFKGEEFYLSRNIDDNQIEKDYSKSPIGGIAESMNSGLLKARTSHGKRIRAVGIDVLYSRYLNNVSQIIVNSEIEKDISTMLNNEKFKEAANALGLMSTIEANFRRALGYKEGIDRTTPSDVISFLSGASARATMAFKFFNIVKQWSSFPAGQLSYEDHPLRFYAEAMQTTAVNLATSANKQVMSKWGRTMYEKSNMFRFRVNEWYRSEIDGSASDATIRLNLGKLGAAASNFAMFSLKKGDLAGVLAGFVPVYKSALRNEFKRGIAEGLSAEDAGARAEKYAVKQFDKYDESQQTQNPALRAPIQDSKLLRFITLYKSSPLLYWNKTQQAKNNIASSIKEGTFSWKNNKKDVMKLLMYRQILNGVFQAVSGVPWLLLRKDDEKEEDFTKAFIASQVLGNMRAFIIGGQTAYNIYSMATGGDAYESESAEGVMYEKLVKPLEKSYQINKKRSDLILKADELRFSGKYGQAKKVEKEIDALEDAESVMWTFIELAANGLDFANLPASAIFEMTDGYLKWAKAAEDHYDDWEKYDLQRRQGQKQMFRVGTGKTLKESPE